MLSWFEVCIFMLSIVWAKLDTLQQGSQKYGPWAKTGPSVGLNMSAGAIYLSKWIIFIPIQIHNTVEIAIVISDCSYDLQKIINKWDYFRNAL